MEKILNPPKEDWLKLTTRPAADKRQLSEVVTKVFDEVRTEGDDAVLMYTKEFDQSDLTSLRVSKSDIEKAAGLLTPELRAAIEIAKNNIEKFHAAQQDKTEVIETTAGVFCWRENRPIERVGLYIPGGTAPLFSTVLMLGIPAKLAGCKKIILCTPPDQAGNVYPAILYTAALVGVTDIFCVGGIQAIAAMTFGTETIPKVDKIFGPGNQYVTAAKQYAQTLGVAIDMPAGPSEVLVIADKNCVPEFVAADLLSQAEHGADSQVILLSDNIRVIEETIAEIDKQIINLPRKEIAHKALEKSKVILLNDMDDCIQFSNMYAPEHLIMATANAKELSAEVINAGSIFLGNYSCESAGDYASGTNHTLPTNGYARNYSGVSLDSFVKKITFQELTKEGLKKLGPAVELMAEAEELFAHKNAVTIRLNSLNYLTPIPSPKERECEYGELEKITRQNIRNLKAYSSARDEFTGKEGVFLDANENPFGTLNRYPDPHQIKLKGKLGELRSVSPENIFIGNGSDEVIDLAFRIFCEPAKSKALTFSPTYGMYNVSAALNDIELIKLPLTPNFQIDFTALENYISDETLKLIFICSPNNPTGNIIKGIEKVLQKFNGIVIVDEAYIDFSESDSFLTQIKSYSNLIVSQTFSKAWGLAGARVGVAYADAAVIQLFDKVKPPYNVSELNQAAALTALENITEFERRKDIILAQRSFLETELLNIPVVKKIYPSDANFLLVETSDAERVYRELVMQKVITRNRNNLVANCIRITVGSPEENKILLNALSKIQ